MRSTTMDLLPLAYVSFKYIRLNEDASSLFDVSTLICFDSFYALSDESP